MNDGAMMLNDLFNQLKYEFQDLGLLKMALTHRSKGGEHNERLEFLGDAIVNFVIAEILYEQFPQAAEGELSRWRATLVNRNTLGELAKGFDLGRYLLLGSGEQRSGGKTRPSILSCTMEAIIGAIYLDGGFDVVRTRIMEWYAPMLTTLSLSSHKDPKTLLQEYLQGRRLALPVYKVDHVVGEAHQQIFTVSCQVDELGKLTLGKGTSRRKAEQDAAQSMFKELTMSSFTK